MARGQKTDTETIYKIMISMFSTGNFNETSRQLDIPVNTVKNIYDNNIEKEEFVKLRTKKEDEFVEKASRIIDKALNRLERSLDEKNEKIPVNNLSTVIGTLYDKKALAKGDPTANTDIHIKMDKKVEELSQ